MNTLRKRTRVRSHRYRTTITVPAGNDAARRWYAGRTPPPALRVVDDFLHGSTPSSNAYPEPAIETLTSKQRAHLRSLAHPLKPSLHIGKDGVTDATLLALQEAFSTHELLKVKVLETAPLTARACGTVIADRLDNVQVVQNIGRIVVLYRPDPDQPRIKLPPR